MDAAEMYSAMVDYLLANGWRRDVEGSDYWVPEGKPQSNGWVWTVGEAVDTQLSSDLGKSPP